MTTTPNNPDRPTSPGLRSTRGPTRFPDVPVDDAPDNAQKPPAGVSPEETGAPADGDQTDPTRPESDLAEPIESASESNESGSDPNQTETDDAEADTDTDTDTGADADAEAAAKAAALEELRRQRPARRNSLK